MNNQDKTTLSAWNMASSAQPYAFVFLVLAGLLLELFVHLWLGVSIVYTHFFYLIIVIAINSSSSYWQLLHNTNGRKNNPGNRRPRLEVVVKSGTESSRIDIVEWARRVEKLGAGEILLTERRMADGTRSGYGPRNRDAGRRALTSPRLQ
jgi:hypothetical protein